MKSPRYTDHCAHGYHAYVTTFTADGNEYDLYVYGAYQGIHVCLRYGDEGHEYVSAGRLPSVIAAYRIHRDELYGNALRVILREEFDNVVNDR